ncbi:hypothetical protein MNEG_11498 [Monoraphidium neglectum]|uniref:Uncharacterized protein n=1 Tax=Monoraphidium neglectum TaxID=145388 RepID=A0A0D2KL12_9CHLO|nr:hypothetical protein MNEG_11498 [Monoraphidium neglectum]KIY96463.1 hypothetical protein MNEG_11498 [Monoraphidium neglectum]|eukprot:XP_013895483.1 hypothetical protein MNEG_11498 [Monoraphidium neglectum]
MLRSRLRSEVAPNRPAPAAARFRPVAHVQRGGTRSIATPLDITIHGRHVDVTPEARSILAALQRQEGARGRRIESHVRDRLSSVLDKFKGAQFLESDGGVALVDVRLMNSQAEVKLQPRIHNKAANDVYVRQGGLKVCESGSGWADSLEKALDALDRKLTKVRSCGSTLEGLGAHAQRRFVALAPPGRRCGALGGGLRGRDRRPLAECLKGGGMLGGGYAKPLPHKVDYRRL